MPSFGVLKRAPWSKRKQKTDKFFNKRCVKSKYGAVKARLAISNFADLPVMISKSLFISQNLIEFLKSW